MQGNVIGDDGMSSVVDGLQHNKSLTKLDVSECGVSLKGSHVFLSLLHVTINTSVIATDCVQRSLGNV